MANYACFECSADVIFPTGAIVVDLVICDACADHEALLSD